MRRVRYIPGCAITHYGLSANKIYVVNRLFNNKDVYLPWIEITNDNGKLVSFYIQSYNGTIEFVDATAEYRDEIIDGILS